ncbi:MAG: hypothetical protein JWQ38_947 [Flavipsychrobacter sp.]|nr:hypothetical protein [Flavipsychrobacter sp.]
MTEQLIPTTTIAEQAISLMVNQWETQNKRVTDFFNKYPDEHYLDEVAPGRNRGIYLLGHLAATNDALLPLLGIGDKLYPELAPLFFSVPDNKEATFPSIAELKQKWEIVNATLAAHFAEMKPQDWLGRHTAVSEEDFAKEPHRNKLTVLLGRTNHQSYHIGQLVFLNPKQ